MSLQDKVVLITGGTSGIGRATAEAFACAGAKVVLAARGSERGELAARVLRQAGADVRFLQADVSRADDVRRLLAAVVATHGRLDAAFNNAGTTDGIFAQTAEFSEEQFDRAITINLKSVWLCMQQEISQMLGQMPAGGAIVNMSSVCGLGGDPGGALYSAAKAGTIALTKAAAQEYAARGIRVNALVAGAFRTPMLEQIFEHYGAGIATGMAQLETRYSQLVPMRRIGNAEEAAAAAVWLCSSAASYVTGHSLIVDGGLTASMR